MMQVKLRLLALGATALLCASCNGGSPAVETPPVSTSIATPALPAVGQANFVGELEVTVLRVSLHDAAESGEKLPLGHKVLEVQLGLQNSTSNDAPVPDFTLSCAGSVVGGRTPDQSAGALLAGTVAPKTTEFGVLLFAVPGSCESGLLIARVTAASGGRPPMPVTIRLN